MDYTMPFPNFPDEIIAVAITESAQKLANDRLAHVYCKIGSGQELDDYEVDLCQKTIADAQDLILFLLDKTEYKKISDSKKEVRLYA